MLNLIKQEFDLNVITADKLNLYEKLLLFFKKKEVIKKNWDNQYMSIMIVKRVNNKNIFLKYMKGTKLKLSKD